jgi:hypothetical protein
MKSAMTRYLAASAIALICAGPAAASSIDFESFFAGDTVDTVTAHGVTATFFGVRNGRTDGINDAMIFDTANVTGGDPDLVPLNSINGAPLTLGKVLILTEDRDASDPDDAAQGGVITVSFDRTIRFLGIDFLDDEIITVSDNMGRSVTSTTTNDNDIERIDVDWAGVTDLTIDLDNSGAIDNLRFEVAPVPLPGALPLLLGGMGAFAVARARRKG